MLEKNCEGCRFHKFPYKIQSPVKSKGIYPLVTFNNKDDIEMIESTSKLYDWCINKGVTIKILSNVNPCDKRFTRIKSINDI